MEAEVARDWRMEDFNEFCSHQHKGYIASNATFANFLNTLFDQT